MKCYIIQKKFLIKNPVFLFLANLIFVVSRLKIHPAVRLITLKTLASLQSERKAFLKFTNFCYS